MKKPFFIALLCTACGGSLLAQTVPLRPVVRATGTASVFVNPDQAEVDVTVTTHAMTAQAAGSQNATQTAAVLAALNQLLGAGAAIKTINYSITPNYNNPPNGGTPTVTGFTANNTVEVTLTGISTIGTVIDTAIQAGATTVAGVRFSLKDSEPARRQALQQAAVNAKAHADAMAAALGGSTGTITVVQEGSAVQPVQVLTFAAAAAATPIQAGPMEVDATVTVEALLN